MRLSIPHSTNSTGVWASTHDTNILHLLCVAKEIGTTQNLKIKYNSCMQASYEIPRLGCVEAESDTGPLPDRLINLGECERVLYIYTTEEYTTAESAENQVLVDEDPRRLAPLLLHLLLN